MHVALLHVFFDVPLNQRWTHLERLILFLRVTHDCFNLDIFHLELISECGLGLATALALERDTDWGDEYL